MQEQFLQRPERLHLQQDMSGVACFLPSLVLWGKKTWSVTLLSTTLLSVTWHYQLWTWTVTFFAISVLLSGNWITAYYAYVVKISYRLLKNGCTVERRHCRTTVERKRNTNFLLAPGVRDHTPRCRTHLRQNIHRPKVCRHTNYSSKLSIFTDWV